MIVKRTVGVGGASAIAGAIYGILLKPLPYPQPQQLVTVWQHDLDAGDYRQEVNPANFLDWRERVTTLEHLVAMEPYGLNWQSSEGPIYLSTQLVYEGFFDAFFLHARDQALFVAFDATGAAPRRHVPPKLVGLAWRVVGRDNR